MMVLVQGRIASCFHLYCHSNEAQTAAPFVIPTEWRSHERRNLMSGEILSGTIRSLDCARDDKKQVGRVGRVGRNARNLLKYIINPSPHLKLESGASGAKL
jgi:hypothetical protein